MKKHICKQCNKVYEYCRGCLLSPISYKENGYCSETCYEASQNKVEPVVEEVVIENVVETISTDNIAPTEGEISIEVETEVIAEEDIPIAVEAKTTTVDEPTIKNETNTYKKKKNKYK